MFIVLIVAFISLFLLYRINNRGFRQSWIYATISFCIYAFFITEALGFFNLLDFTHLFLGWALFALVLTAFNFLKLNFDKHLLNIRQIFNHFAFVDVIIITVIIGISFVLFIIALKSPPNNWDSMTYHLSRIEHWIQNKNLQFYPTHIERQLYMGPFSEILIMQVRMLSGGDLLNNLVQFFAMITSLIAISLIAKELGCNIRGQLVAGVVALTIPTGIVQSTSTQNDYVVAFFSAAFIFLVLTFIKDAHLKYDYVFLGSILGLAILTKPTAYFYFFPFVAWLCLHELHRIKKLQYSLIIILISIAFNAPQFSRNYLTYNNIFGPESSSYKVGMMSPQYLVSNAIKNLTIHLGTNDAINNLLFESLSSIHQFFGVDINARATTWQDQKYVINLLSTDEDYSGNLLHLLLLVVASIVLINQSRQSSLIRKYILFSWMGFILIITFLRWQPWSGRFHLPFFVIMAPIISLLFTKNNKNCLLGCFFIIITSFPWLFLNQTKSLVGLQSIFQKTREEIMFTKRPELMVSYGEAVNYLIANNYRDIGLYLGGDDWEYPLWSKLRQKYGNEFRLEHVNVSNMSKKNRVQFNPEIIVCINCSNSDYQEQSKSKIKYDNIDLIPIKYHKL